MTRFYFASLGLAIALGVVPSALGQQAPAPVSVELSEAQQQKLGVVLAALAPASMPMAADAYGSVVDVSPLAALSSEIAGARAAALASRAEANRLARLAAQDQSASRQATEAAEATAQADETRVALAERKVGLEWGPSFARMSNDDLNRLLGQIARGEAALVRIDGIHNAEPMPKQASLRDKTGAPLTSVAILGVAATLDPRFQTPGLFGIARGPAAAGLRPGRVLAAELGSGPNIAGVILPRSALVRIDAATWAYVQTGAGSFERRQVIDARQLRDGWFVAKGFDPGDKLVVAGAGALIAAEHADESKGGN